MLKLSRKIHARDWFYDPVRYCGHRNMYCMKITSFLFILIFTFPVYSTILTATSPIYQVNEGGGVELTLTASTKSSSWENITINVTKPDGSNDSITINSPNDANESANITYLIQNANLTTDLGNYVFEAIEGSVPADSPKTETITVICKSIIEKYSLYLVTLRSKLSSCPYTTMYSFQHFNHTCPD